MKTTTHTNEFIGKVLPDSLGQPLNRENEYKKINNSSARWWFECLLLSDEYKSCCENVGISTDKDISTTYKSFGNIFEYQSFIHWWMRVGRDLFEEQTTKEVKFIRNERDLRRLRFNINKIVIEVPLNLRRQTVIRKIGKQLKAIYEDFYKEEALDIYKESSAKIKFQKSKMQTETVKLLLKIIRLRKEHPKLPLAKIGAKARIVLDLGAKTVGEQALETVDQDFIDRRMTIAVSRYTKQANNLINEAARGKFPFLKNKSTRRRRISASAVTR